MVTNMKRNSLTLPIVGGSISLICFFLPWIKFDMSALGLDLFPTNLDGPIYVSGFRFVMNGATFEILTFLATLTILGVCIYMLKQKTPWKSRMPVLISSSYGCIYIFIGIIVSIIADIDIASRKIEFASSDTNLDEFASLQFGLFGVIVGFALAFIGVWNIPKKNPFNENNET